MTRRSNIWLVLAFLFGLLNVVATGWAAAHGELLHACGHVVLAVLSVYAVRRLLGRRQATY